ncbi:right-handed parallel beta-helix repeat-containing protein [Cohnella sp. GCM10020058]|uniref:right-handed parallel beta-helix repeat-containing protein n=1 Tax=Cohnella sp. GCM10020058 TaxID=3317330 RepID=UPI003640C8F1
MTAALIQQRAGLQRFKRRAEAGRSPSLFSAAPSPRARARPTHTRRAGARSPGLTSPLASAPIAFRLSTPAQFACARTLTAIGTGTVKAAERLSDRLLEVTLADPVPEAVEEGNVVENVTWTPEVHIAGNRFARIPTRGILLTTRRPAIIENDTFEQMRKSAVWIEGASFSWFESGPVRDLTIRGNKFVDCGDTDCPVVAVVPAVSEPDAERPVHRGIRLTDNRFETRDAVVLEAHGTRGLVFSGNEITAVQTAGFAKLMDAIRLTACADTDIRDNRFLTGNGS